MYLYKQAMYLHCCLLWRMFLLKHYLFSVRYTWCFNWYIHVCQSGQKLWYSDYLHVSPYIRIFGGFVSYKKWCLTITNVSCQMVHTWKSQRERPKWAKFGCANCFYLTRTLRFWYNLKGKIHDLLYLRQYTILPFLLEYNRKYRW